jgi:fatty acid desaturase
MDRPVNASDRSELWATLAQAGAAGCAGAWAASIIEPPNGARWALLAIAVGLAAAATVLHRRARGES